MALPSDSTIVKKILHYVSVKKDDLPILKECCLINNWPSDELERRVEDSPRVKKAVQVLTDQKEVNLERFSILGTYNPRIATYLLEILKNGHSTADLHSRLLALDKLLLQDEADASNLGFPDTVM